MVLELSGEIDPKNTDFVYEHLFCHKGRYQDAIDMKGTTTKLSQIDRVFIKMIDGGEVLDVGGAGGIHYFRLGEPNCKWRVFEFPEVVEFMKAQSGLDGIEFEDTTIKLSKSTDLPAYLFISGTIQYLEHPLKFLEDNRELFEGMYLRGIYKSNKTYLDYQVGVGPYWVLSIDDIKKALGKGFDIEIKIADETDSRLLNILVVRK